MDGGFGSCSKPVVSRLFDFYRVTHRVIPSPKPYVHTTHVAFVFVVTTTQSPNRSTLGLEVRGIRGGRSRDGMSADESGVDDRSI